MCHLFNRVPACTGVSHADDVTYFLNVSFIKDEPRYGLEKDVEVLILDLWTSFAKDG